jgi:hypothetical protein
MIKRLLMALAGRNTERAAGRREGAEQLPPAAHPAVRPDEPRPLDDMPVAPLTEPDETKGG